MNDAKATLLAERADMIGGSDALHLTNLEPLGCARRLIYDKALLPADYPFTGNDDTRRGEVQEPIAVALYEEVTRRTCAVHGLIVGGKPFQGVHPDRAVYHPERERPGLLEVKVPRYRTFNRFRAEGKVAEHWVLQAQWGLFVSGWEWAGLCIFSPEIHQIMDPALYPFVDLEPDRPLHRAMDELSQRLWRVVQQERRHPGRGVHQYPRLPDGDRRCLECPWRRTCRNLDALPPTTPPADLPDEEPQLDESMAGAVVTYLDARRANRSAKTAFEEARQLLAASLGERRHVLTSAGRVYVNSFVRRGKTGDGKERLTPVSSLQVVASGPEGERDDE